MLNAKPSYSRYGSMLRLPWLQAHKTVFRPPVVVNADALQIELDQRFDVQIIATGDCRYRVRGKTD